MRPTGADTTLVVTAAPTFVLTPIKFINPTDWVPTPDKLLLNLFSYTLISKSSLNGSLGVILSEESPVDESVNPITSTILSVPIPKLFFSKVNVSVESLNTTTSSSLTSFVDTFFVWTI